MATVFPIVTLALAILLGMGESIVYRGKEESYTSDVSLERFYLLEENVMSNADALVREEFFGLEEEEETEEEHKTHTLNVTEVEGILARAKDLHREVGPELWDFLGHPINLFHLFRRLNDEWKKGLDLLLKSTPCKLWKIRAMRRYLGFLRDDVPDEEDSRLVVKHMTRLQKIYGNPTDEVANGRLGNIQAGKPLSVDEQYVIGKILYEDEDFQSALSWFELVDDWLKKATKTEVHNLAFKQTDLLGKMATAYYLVGKIDEAVDISNRHLDLDTSNLRVLDNLNFFLVKQTLQPVHGPPARLGLSNKTGPRNKLDKICAGQVLKPSRKRCIFEPVYGPISWVYHKKEVLRHRPAIFIYHDVIDEFTMDQLKNYVHGKLATKAWISPSVFITPQMGIEIDYPGLPKKKSIRYSAQKLSRGFSRVPGPDRRLLKGWGRMQILNAGRSGVNLNQYGEDLELTRVTSDDVVGVMYAFLSEPKQGGEIVMKSREVFSPAPKGSILVYYANKSRLHSQCPVLGGSQWIAVQPFYQRDAKICWKKH